MRSRKERDKVKRFYSICGTLPAIGELWRRKRSGEKEDAGGKEIAPKVEEDVEDFEMRVRKWA